MRKEAVYFFSFLLDGPTTELKISKNQSLLDGAQAKLKDTLLWSRFVPYLHLKDFIKSYHDGDRVLDSYSNAICL